jgi:oxaloacetate decarboxylase gamma subunit
MDDLFSQGIELAGFGIGTVFLFLALLILVTRLMSLIVVKFQSEKTISDGAFTETQRSGFNMQTKNLAIISTAIMEHRKKN